MIRIIQLIVILIANACFGSEIINVLETTFVPSFNEDTEYYFGFAEGDQIVFSFEVIKGRAVNEIEVSEYLGSSRFSDVKTTRIVDKVLTVSTTGIYKFRIRGAFRTKKCRLTIQRIPASSELMSFNTSVYWRTVNDTSFYYVNEQYLASVDTSVVNLGERTEKVHSVGNLNGNKNTFNYLLPENTVAWSYYIGVNQEGQKAFEEATSDLAKSASPIVARIPGYGPLAALALGGISYLTKLQRGEDIEYYIVENGQQSRFLAGYQPYYLKKGKVINDFSQMPKRSGMIHFCLKNDNAITGVSVMVCVSAITIKENWEIREVEKFSVSQRKEAFLKE